MKKFFVFFFFCLTVSGAALIYNYLNNEKSAQVSFYTVAVSDVQNSIEMRGVISKNGNVYAVSGVIPKYKAEDLQIGVSARVKCENREYDGYLYELKPTYNDLYDAKISIITSDPIGGEAIAAISGNLKKNIIMVPYSCVFTDENGKDAIMVENLGYAIKRNIKLGKINNDSGTEIIDGVFLNEKLIMNPHSIKTGDRVN
jgi:hypothetical protein